MPSLVCSVCNKTFFAYKPNVYRCSLKCRDKFMVGKNAANYRHGGLCGENKDEYNSYRAMKNRCYSKNYRAYHRYGGRGIKVCDRWLGKDGFSNFLIDMGKKPSSGYSIDRIDNDSNYSPGNCRWANQKTQTRNSSRVLFIEIEGTTKSLKEWCDVYGTKPSFVYQRIKTYGWDVKRSITEPKYKRGHKYIAK